MLGMVAHVVLRAERRSNAAAVGAEAKEAAPERLEAKVTAVRPKQVLGHRCQVSS